MKNFYNVIIFCFSAGTAGWANDGNLIGRVYDQDSNEEISGANISIEGHGRGTFSDGSGNFTLEDLDPGTYTLKISSIGFESFSREIEIQPGLTTEIDVPLTESITVLEGVIVNRIALVGGTGNIRNIAGSAHYLKPKDLNKFNNTDINRVLRNVPGIIIQEEDGFGLRPNIGMRGTGVERSSKITLMEDGILTAPAPYAAPEAYYFPSLGRMSGIEVRKGSSQIKYGPYTTGGAINFISTPIPGELDAQVNLFAGSDGFYNMHTNVGSSFKNFGFVAESLITSSDGFKELDNGGNTGFIKEDYLAKFRVNSDPNARVYQSLSIKAGLTKEHSNETYLGLTDEDFEETPFRRYAGSQKDNMQNRHTQWHLRHAIQPTKFMDITTTVYHSSFERNWYKLDKVKASDTTAAVGISSILSDPELYAAELDIIRGGASNHDDALMVKANNRSYFLQGIESIIGLSFPGHRVDNDLEIGIRLHRDQMDRFQWVDGYTMRDGTMMQTLAGTPGTESNYVLDARAIASFIQYRLEYGKLALTPGLRYEHIHYEKRDYGKGDPDRTGADLKSSLHGVDVFIPGLGIDYAFTGNVNSFFGIHKGFSPPGLKEGTKPEISINYEAGIRYYTPVFSLQGVFYFNDYENLLGSDMAATGGTGTGDQYNGGESLIYGVEYDMVINPLGFRKSQFALPIGLNYTYTHATFENSFDSEFESWGNVQEGDAIPYIPQHQVVVNITLEHKKFNLNYSSKYVSTMRAVAGQGDIAKEDKIPGYYVADLSANVVLKKYVTLYGSVNNLFNNVYVVSRRPAGLRPGMPLSFRIGIKAHIF